MVEKNTGNKYDNPRESNGIVIKLKEKAIQQTNSRLLLTY